MLYDCTTLSRESKSVGRCLRDESGTLEFRVCCLHVHDFGSSSGGGSCLSLTNMIRGRVSRRSEVEEYCPRQMNHKITKLIFVQTVASV